MLLTSDRLREAMSVEFHNVKCIAETARAIRVRFEDGTEVWCPKSQIDDDSEVFEDGGEGTFIVSDWIAEKEGWEP